MKKAVSVIILAFLLFSMISCGMSQEAKAVSDLIDAIGTVSLESKGAIDAADNALKALTAEQAAELKNTETLELAKKRI